MTDFLADQRYYTANAGRFYTADPAGLAGADLKNPTIWNKYVYAGDDPVNFNDPMGLCTESWDPSTNTLTGCIAPLPPTGWGFCGAGSGASDGYGGAPPVWDGPGWKKGYLDEIHGGLTPEARAILGMVYGQTSFITTGKFWASWLAVSVAGATAPLLYASASGGIAALDVASGPGSVYVIGTLKALQGALGPEGTKLMELPDSAYEWERNQDILQKIMSWGNPIRDLNGAEAAVQGSMLDLERKFLDGAHWVLQQAQDGYYYWTKP